ncbi:MAG: OsmC family protein [Planctomycetota bacterium]|jgi:putative redox protein
MGKLKVTYDGPQHCAVLREPQGNTTAMDCPYTGKGEEFSPSHLLGASVAGCMMLSMGTLAMRDGTDLTGMTAEADVNYTEGPVMRITGLDLVFSMPAAFGEKERTKLERAAEMCPIKHTFGPEVTVSVKYVYPE